MKSAFYGVRTSVLVPLLGFLAFVLCTGLALADTEQHNEFEGSIDAVFYDAPLNQLQVNGWAWDTVTALPAAKLRISVRGHDYQANSLSRIARKDVATARAIPVLETGFSSTIALSEALPGGLHPVEVTAIFSDDRSVRLLSWSGETPRVPVDKPRSRHWILLALVLGWIALACVPRLRQWGDRAGNWVKTHPHRISTAIGATFLLLVAFGITGSSLQLLSQGPQGPFGLGAMEFKGSSARIFKPRDLRSDEWGVLTPNALAQWQHNPPFPVVNTNLGLEGQNMGVIGMTGAPIAQPAALARPATWGYFLLPLRQALSWHWQLPFFACLFFLWKALNLLRPRTPGFNLALAATFCVAPYAAAWSLWPLYAAFFPLALFVTTAAALRTGSVAKTLPLGAAMGLLLAGWVLVLYPPWQITVGTFFVALTIGWVADHRHELQFRKAQWLCIGLALLIAAALVGSWWLDTADAVEQMRATIYPGSRNVLQGGEIGNLWALRGYTNPETLTFGVGPHTNQSEISSYILFPLPILLLGLLHCKRTSSGRWTVRACMAFIAFWIVFRFFGVPLWLAKITLWSYVPSGRLDLAIGLACTVLMALIHTDRQPHAPNSRARLPLLTALCVAAGGAGLVFMELHLLPREIFANNSRPFLWAMLLAGLFGSWWMMRGQMRSTVSMILLLSLVSTLGFNPVSRAPRSLDLPAPAAALASENTQTHKPLLRTLVIGGWGVGPMTLAAVGVPTINGVLYYPQREFWEKIGLAPADWPTVNRYQHLGFALANLPAGPTFRVQTNHLDAVNVAIDPRRFDFASTGAQRVAALEEDAKSLRDSPHLSELGQHGGLFWFAVRNGSRHSEMSPDFQ